MRVDRAGRHRACSTPPTSQRSRRPFTNVDAVRGDLVGAPTEAHAVHGPADSRVTRDGGRAAVDDRDASKPDRGGSTSARESRAEPRGVVERRGLAPDDDVRTFWTTTSPGADAVSAAAVRDADRRAARRGDQQRASSSPAATVTPSGAAQCAAHPGDQSMRTLALTLGAAGLASTSRVVAPAWLGTSGNVAVAAGTGGARQEGDRAGPGRRAAEPEDDDVARGRRDDRRDRVPRSARRRGRRGRRGGGGRGRAPCRPRARRSRPPCRNETVTCAEVA